MRLPSKAAPSLLREAIQYAERGWSVIPLVPHRKVPKTKQGVLQASNDPLQIAKWWTRTPHANIGLRTGEQFDVLDIDGDEGLSSLDTEAGPEHRHSGPVSHTGKGTHWLFAASGTANRQALLPKVDWRGVNGYIVAPPSIHPDGHRYAWDPEHGPDAPLPDVPDWLAPYMTPWRPANSADHTIRGWTKNTHSKKVPTTVNVYGLDKVAGRLIDIVQMASDLGYDPQPDGRLFVIHCPFHEGDREPSLKLYPDNSFFCYGCGAWGDSLNLQQHRPGGPRAER